MEKRPFFRAEHLTKVLAVYFAGFVVAFLIYEAQKMLGQASFADGSPLSDAARWPLDLLHWVM